MSTHSPAGLLAGSTWNIGFVSTRIAGTDGVSLEIKKWADVLIRNGHRCFYCAGELDRSPEVSHLVEEAHFEHPEVESIGRDLFGKTHRGRETSRRVHVLKDRLKSALYEFRDKFQIDVLVPENALAIPMNVPLGLALTEFIAETSIPVIAHHHDFSWERNRFLLSACRDYLDSAFPPNLPSIQHVVINSLAAQQLSYRRGISNTVIPNVLDFATEASPPDAYTHSLREQIGLEAEDLFILQPTRVVPRKWIERSIEIVHHLALPRPALVISHASGDEGDDYSRRIHEYARHLGVELISIEHLVAPERGTNKKGERVYTIGDVYGCADLVTYPSGYEGFGNAFLEAVYYRKPIVVNRYSTYVTDIEPRGFDVILMDGFVGSEAIRQIHDVLGNEKRLEAMLQRNYELARRHFSYEVLEACLLHLLDVHSLGGCQRP